MKKTITLFILLVTVILFLTGCADTVQVQECINSTEHVYGFWGGTWHGMIMPFSFIGSLFSDSIAVYAVSNNGGWYNFGFVGGFWAVLKLIGFILDVYKK